MKKVLLSLFVFFFLISASAIPLYAAMVKSGDSVYLPESEENLHDLYLFGNTVTVDAPVTNDFITAGNTITVNGNITGNLMAAGNDITIRSSINDSARVAGSTIVISGSVGRDLLAAGAHVRTTKDASISGDLLFAGGELRIEGPVNGNIHANGGKIFIDAPVSGNVDGNIGELTLGKNAIIAGNLNYTSDQKAEIQPGAVVRGRQEYRQGESKKNEPTGPASFFTTGALYKLTIDIIVSLLLITFVPMLVKSTLERAVNKPVASAGSGFLLLIFLPLLSLFLFFLLWVGVASFLFYGLLIILTIFLSKLLIGWWIMRWWSNRNKKDYILDWKAAIIGPVVAFIMIIIPVLGWLALIIIYLMTFGALARSVLAMLTTTDSNEIIKEHKKAHNS